MTVEVKVPDIGDFKDIPVIEVFVKPGDKVEAEDSLVTLESDKATMDVPSPAAGVVKEVRVKLGDKVSEGSPIVVLESEGAAGADDVAGAGAAGADPPAEVASVATTAPSETLSPTLSFTSCTVPPKGAGTSIVALSDSSVTSASSALTVSPAFTCTSITGTSLKSPMSGT